MAAASAVCEYSKVSAISWMGELLGDKSSKEWRDSSRVQSKLDKANITSVQLTAWKECNTEKSNRLKEANNSNISKATNQVIVCMIKERESYIDTQQFTRIAYN